MSVQRETGPGGVQDTIQRYLEARHWFVIPMTCGKYQKGVPDLWAAHKTYGARWIEVKRPDRWTFTRDQKRIFPKITAKAIGIWVMQDVTDYPKLFGPPNLDQFKPFGNPPKKRRNYRAK